MFFEKITQGPVWLAQGVFYPDFYSVVLENSRLKHVHLSVCISMMKICWSLADKVMNFHLPVT